MGVRFKIFNMRKRIVAGGVVQNSKGEILIVNQNNNSWSLPKGGVDARETEIETAKREIYEESGIKRNRLKLIKKLGSYQRYRIGPGGVGEDKTESRIMHVYFFKTDQLKLSPIDPENPEAKWVAKGQVANWLTHSKDKKFFEKIKEQLT